MKINIRRQIGSLINIPPSSNGFDQAVTNKGSGLTNPGPYLYKDVYQGIYE